jgi:hypothetical protein
MRIAFKDVLVSGKNDDVSGCYLQSACGYSSREENAMASNALSGGAANGLGCIADALLRVVLRLK